MIKYFRIAQIGWALQWFAILVYYYGFNKWNWILLGFGIAWTIAIFVIAIDTSLKLKTLEELKEPKDN